MAANMGHLAPLKRESRPVGEPSGFTIHHLASDRFDGTAARLRFQVLVGKHQVEPGLAGLVASLVFGEARQ